MMTEEKQSRKNINVKPSVITEVVKRILQDELPEYIENHDYLKEGYGIFDLESNNFPKYGKIDNWSDEAFKSLCQNRRGSDIRKELKTMISINFGIKYNIFDITAWKEKEQKNFLYLMYSIRKLDYSMLQKSDKKLKLPNLKIFYQLKTGRMENYLLLYTQYLLHESNKEWTSIDFGSDTYSLVMLMREMIKMGDIKSLYQRYLEYRELFFEGGRSFVDFLSFFLMSLEVMGALLINADDYRIFDFNQRVEYADLIGKTKTICDNIKDVIVTAGNQIYPKFGILEMYIFNLYIDTTIVEGSVEENILTILSEHRCEKRKESLNETHLDACRKIILWMQENNILDETIDYFDDKVFALVVKEIWQDKTKYKALNKNIVTNNIYEEKEDAKERRVEAKRGKAAFEIAKDVLNGKYDQYGNLSEDIIFIREKIKRAAVMANFGKERNEESEKNRIKRLNIERLMLIELGKTIQVEMAK